MKNVVPLNNSDIEQIRAQGITEELVFQQIESFRKGFPFMELVRPAVPGDGIELIEEDDVSFYRNVFRTESKKGRASIFVPASGAASRMFKALEGVYKRDSKQPDMTLASLLSEDSAVAEFVKNVERFACYEALKQSAAKSGIDIEVLKKEGRYVLMLEHLLTSKGLGYASLPKGLIEFHREKNRVKTPFEEHLIEASLYLKDAGGRIKIHFTVPEAFDSRIREHIETLKRHHEKNGLHFETTFSRQKPSTDTVAVDLENLLFRDGISKLVFRPAGHGALLDNLAELKGDIVFIKNIDNVLPDRNKPETVKVQELLGGYLVDRAKLVHSMLRNLSMNSEENMLNKAIDFIKNQLGTASPEGSAAEKLSWAMGILNRPMRVCGMVRNEGEPGGGPFWVRGADGRVSKQIVEKSQVDTGNEAQRKILGSATHFNPVDLVCGLRDFEGKSFDLKQYVDRETGFISVKSKEGRELKALELPGLWNGAMAWWLTFFVEIPVETFGPVKEFNDLLRSKHQGDEGPVP